MHNITKYCQYYCWRNFMENINIRNYIIENFKEDNEEKIRDSIETTIKFKDEDALIGLGVLFELLWENLSEEEKKESLKKINNAIKKPVD